MSPARLLRAFSTRPVATEVERPDREAAPGAASKPEPVRPWRIRRLHRRAGRVHTDARAYYMRRVLAVADSAAILIALALCFAVAELTPFATALPQGVLVSPLLVLSWVVLAGAAGMYHVDDRRIDCSVAEEIFRVAQLVALWVWLVFLLVALVDEGSPPVAQALALGLFAVPAILSSRALARRLARTRPWYRQIALIFGTEEDCRRIQRILARHTEYGVEVVDMVHPGISNGNGNSGDGDAEGAESLISIIDRDGADRVIFASNYEGIEERTGALRFLAEEGVKVDLVPGDSDVFRADAELHQIEGLPLLTLPTTVRARSAATLKRMADVTISSTILTCLSPLLLAAAIAIKLNSPGPVFFRQRRVGQHREFFTLLKFRTMVDNAEELKPALSELNTRTDCMFKIPDDPRITRVGGWLRRYSLDELPQLLNVLRGDMSLVGPRPLIEAESERVSERYAARFDVRPGITGPWQVLGRSDIPFEDMVKLDYTYVTNWSLSDDVKLMVRTLSAMGAGKGAY